MEDQLKLAIHKAYRMNETICINALLKEAEISEDRIQKIETQARELVQQTQQYRLKSGGLDAFLQTYDLSTEEGVALMCLAEALLRIPDSATRDQLIKDKILNKNWEQHLSKSHSLFVNSATWSLLLTGKILHSEKSNNPNWLSVIKRLISKGGGPIVREAIVQAMKILGEQFVMGETIEEAMKRAVIQEAKGYRYSYDMLGEAAKTRDDAEIYYIAYLEAIRAITKSNAGEGAILGPGISIKLSALHPRYEWVKRERILSELLPKLKILALEAKIANIGFTIDAEEADRLDLSLLLLEQLLQDPDLQGWNGLGLAVQAYQKRASFVIDWLIHLGRTHHCRLMVRLVKGAYWDSEIKWSQERGLKDYPVFTHKSYTDVSYLVCAKKILSATDVLYPQFATHNAYTVAAVLELANGYRDFEFQCLHGMGDSLYNNIVDRNKLSIPCRVYAPVGGHKHLLAYLVRRLLENGANTSFVNRILDEKNAIDAMLIHPVNTAHKFNALPHPRIPLPIHIYGAERSNSIGLDLSDTLEIEPLLAAVQSFLPQVLDNAIKPLTLLEIEHAVSNADKATFDWDQTPIEERSECLIRMAGLLETNKPELIALLIRESGKTIPDAVSEIREAIDYCWYYSARAKTDLKNKILHGPTGEYNVLSMHGRGIIACISPWNFPLAIFLGQVVASLVAGNTVLAKPASQTPLIAAKAIRLLHEAGIPKNVVQLLVGSGSAIGNSLTQDLRIQGIMFTGSTETAWHINQVLAARKGPIIPFIAETGGQNTMIVDSSALPEQVVSDVLTSAFNSAGQRCSALRVLFIQEEVAAQIIAMLKGAMQELQIGDPALLATDIGPVIDEQAAFALTQHAARMDREAELIQKVEILKLPVLEKGVFFAPRAYLIQNINILTEEIFGPILHIIQYKAKDLDQVIDSIHQTGFGLTLGIHSRIDETVEYIRNRVNAGNIYVNRNMIGAVVGVQPFGGERLSGTGPKAGGPHILPRLCQERSLSINIAAVGGNVSLMSLEE